MKNAGRLQPAQFTNMLFAFLGLVFLAAGTSDAQINPDTIKIRAIFYDFHTRANSQDTDFSSTAAMGCTSTGKVSGMTADSLSRDRKPVPTAADCKSAAPLYPCACHLPSWFRPSGATSFDTTSCIFVCDSGQTGPLGGSRHGSPTNPVWYWVQRNGSPLPSYKGRVGEFIGPNFDSANNKFANVIIYDSLPFVKKYTVGPSFYEFKTGSFNPIDARGFGNEGYSTLNASTAHNYGYAMELHYKFVYQTGMKFVFSGSGDIWCYINGYKRIDLGGAKTAAVSDTISLDAVPGLLPGNYYNFDFFYAQRYYPGGGLTLQINTVPASPASMIAGLIEPDTITAGDTTSMRAKILDTYGNEIPAASDSIHWTVDTGSNKKTGDLLLSPRGLVLNPPNSNMNDTARFTATAADKPFRPVHITATYRNSVNVFTKTLTVYVKPGPRDHIMIEPSANLPAGSPYKDNPLGGDSRTITMSTNFLNDTAYAVWRDQCGNFLSFDSNATWSSSDGTGKIVSVTPGVTTLGSGIIHNNLGDTSGQTTSIIAADGPTGKKDTVRVTTIGRGYDFLQIVKFNPYTGTYDSISGLKPLIDSVGTADTLYAVGHLPNTSIIKRVSVNWFTNLSTVSPPPPNQDQWSGYQPSDTGHGKIWITWPGGNGTQSDTVQTAFVVGGANSLLLYPQAGPPTGTNVAFQPPPTVAVSVRAGDSIRLYAGLWNNAFWLRKYQDSAAWSQRITWTISNGDTLQGNNNYYATFKPHRAYRVDTITARVGSVIGQVLVRVLPGPAKNVAIVGTTNIGDSSSVQKLGSLTMAATDDSIYLYAAVRDAWNNLVRFDTATSWISSDPSVVTAAISSRLIGQGKIKRVASQGTVKVIARDTLLNLADTLALNVSTFTWTGVVISSSSTLAQRLGSLTYPAGAPDTLYAWGLRNGLQPIRVIVNWSNDEGLTLNPTAPVDSKWGFQATTTGSGYIRVALPGTAFKDSVACNFTVPPAANIVLYRHQAGAPQPEFLFPHFPLVDTLSAGDADSIDAKVFNFNGQWMPLYDAAPADSLISWTVTKLSGPGASDTLKSRTGHFTFLKARKAYALYKVKATYTLGSITIRDSAQIYVKPGAANHLVIERAVPQRTDSLPLIRDQRPDTLRFYANDSTIYAFAVLRDRDSNYVQMCGSTQWNPLNLATPPALDSSIITAHQGLAAEGQGVLSRAPAAAVGRAKVAAVNSSFIYQCDTANVAIEAVAYDSLRIMVVRGTDTTAIDTLNMPADIDTNLYVEGKIHATHGWSKGDSVKANWMFIPNSGTSIGINNQHKWDFAPSSTGSGKIIVSAGGAVPETLGVYIRPGSAANVVLYRKTSAPDSTSSDTAMLNPALAGPPAVVTAVAGTPVSLAALVFDRAGSWVSSYDNPASYNSYFRWTARSRRGDVLDSLLDAGQAGVAQHFTPQRAYDTVSVVVQLTISPTNKPLDTVLIAVLPGAATHVVLEKTPVNTAMYGNAANSCDTLFIPGNADGASVYAVLRDKFNNAVSPDADISITGTLNLAGAPDVTLIWSSKGSDGEVQAHRNGSSGDARLFATDTRGYSDSCLVRLLPFSYTALRIMTGRSGDTIPNAHAQLAISSDSTYPISVQGKRRSTVAGDSVWEEIPGGAVWQVSPSLSSMLSGSAGSSVAYTIRPSDTGTGWIRVTTGNDGATLPDTLRVSFTAGGPAKAAIQIVTPPAQRKAGQPIKAAIIIQDRHGNPVRRPNATPDTMTASFRDTIGRADRTLPFLITQSDPADSVWLDTSNSRDYREIFTDGIDTANIFLFYAPAPGSDSAHQIFVNLKSGATSISGKSDTFTLLPGTLNSMRIYAGVHRRDTVVLPDPTTGDSSVTFRSKGIDVYGNTMGDVPTRWRSTGTLDPVDTTIAQATLFFPPSGITRDEQGHMNALYSDGIVACDSVVVIVMGPAPTIIKAVTADTNGNGLLDKIYLQFSKPVSFPDANAMTAYAKKITCTSDKDGTILVPATLTGSGESYSLILQEGASISGTFQTGWKPTVTASRFDTLGVRIGAVVPAVTAVDAAGPVIWKVKRTKGSASTNTQDTVVIKLSENCRTSDWVGAKAPGTIIKVWTKNGSQFVPAAAMLDGITSFARTDDSTVTFRMSNDSSLNAPPLYYFSIDTMAENRVYDVAIPGNPSPSPNQPQPISFDFNFAARVTPNPMRPTGGDGGLVLKEVPYDQADQWVRINKKDRGTLLIFDITIPTTKTADQSIVVKGRVSLYDMTGNLVASASNDRFAYYSAGWRLDDGGSGQPVAAFDPSTTTAKAMIYWSGANGKGATVAPGVYRVVGDFYSSSGGYKTIHMTGKVGVRGTR